MLFFLLTRFVDQGSTYEILWYVALFFLKIFFFFIYRDAQPRIGDLMKTNAPFLKLYTEYVRNFDHAMNLINTWMEKSLKFSCLIKEIQVSMALLQMKITCTCTSRLGVTNWREFTMFLDCGCTTFVVQITNFNFTC